MIVALGIFLGTLPGMSGCSPSEPSANGQPAAADLVLLSGSIFTLDSARSWAEAVAIRDGRIIYVGNDHGVRGYIDGKTRTVDLAGRMVLPGLHDVHIHALRSGVELLGVDLNDKATLDEYLAAVNDYALEHPRQDWISGVGWLVNVFGPGARASRELLDAIVPDRPVYLESADGHSAWVNSKALELAGIDASTPDPPGGLIDREPGSKVPLGSLQEKAILLVRDLTQPTLEDRMLGMRNSMRLLHSYGITSIQEAKAVEPELEAYRELEKRGELDLRLVVALEWDTDEGIEQLSDILRLRDQYASEKIRTATVKIWQDGVMENFTASLLEPYLDQDGARGLSMVGADDLNKLVTVLDAEGFQVHFHAIGDAATRESLDAVEAARRANGERGHRHHIAHLQLIDPADIARFRELGVIANYQPLWAYADPYITELTVPFLGPERSRWLYPIGSVLRSGAIVAFSSDWSVASANPFWGMEVAITRSQPVEDTTPPFVPEESITLEDAIAGYTVAGAWVNHSEQVTGSIEVGKYADLIVLDRNLFEIEIEQISDTRVLLTLFEGRVVHGDFAAL